VNEVEGSAKSTALVSVDDKRSCMENYSKYDLATEDEFRLILLICLKETLVYQGYC